MQFLTKPILQWEPCDDDIWTRKLVEYYGDDIILGELSPDQYLRKLSDVFTLVKADRNMIPDSTYEMCFRTLMHKALFRDVWIVKKDDRSELFYDLFRQDYEDETMCILYSGAGIDHQFHSNANIFSHFLHYYRGINSEDLHSLSNRARIYLNVLDGMSTLLTAEYGENVLLNLTTSVSDHGSYLKL